MESVQAITLGKPPKDPDQGDQRVANMMKILERGFPSGMLAALCRQCNKFEEFGLEGAAIMIVDRTWPHCCKGLRMEMIDPEEAPRY